MISPTRPTTTAETLYPFALQSAMAVVAIVMAISAEMSLLVSVCASAGVVSAQVTAASAMRHGYGLKDNPQMGAQFLTGFTTARGGLPIKIGEDVVGAAAVSGAPGGEKDEACVQTGLDKVKDQLK